MRRAALLSLGLFAALPAATARAWTPDAAIEHRLAQGESWMEVKPDPAGASGLVRAAAEIDAPPATVWGVMVDCDLAPRMVPNLRSCKVLERDPQGRWDVREQVSRPMLLPPLRAVVRYDYDPPRGFIFRRVGGDLPVLEGDWRLEPLAGGRRTRVTYESRAALPVAAPGPLARIVLRHEIALSLAALKRECADRDRLRAAR